MDEVIGTTVADIRKISVALTKEQMADLQAAVAAGAYASIDEVVLEAIAAWQLAHALRDDEMQRLRALWDAGKADGATRKFDVERTIATARTRLGEAAAE
jgi:antitoxin ParD1/3/4